MENQVFICENCGKEHNGSYGSGRFCSDSCKCSYNVKKRKKHVCNFNKETKEGGWNCKCGLNFKTRKLLNLHRKECKVFPIMKTGWNKGLTKETDERIKKQVDTYKKHLNDCKFTPSFLGKHHTEKTKKTVSEKRKLFLKNNPEKHPWKKNSKFISVPCQILKKKLREKKYVFVEEYTDKNWDKNYSLDIAFLEKKIAIEVNGNQHYEKNGDLKEYYKQRHLFLENKGWTILEFHYTFCFKEEKINELFLLLAK